MRQGPAPRAVSGPIGVAGLAPQAFYVLAETPCPYLPGQRERKLITELTGPAVLRRYSQLSRAGFRRSHSFAYRPACSGCTACVPVRVAVKEFRPTRSLRRVARANAGLIAEERPALATAEQFALFARYIVSRHDDGEMAGMTFADYRSMVEHTQVDTRMVEFRAENGRLIAGCLTDWLEDGPSAVYSFFEPDWARRSLGTYAVLWLIDEARRRGLAHVYLGYRIAASPKMAYKARFRPLQAFGPQGWRAMAE